MLIVRYIGDIERKRLEYLMSRWGHKFSFKKIQGAVVMIEGPEDGIEEFVKEVYSRIPRDRVEVYSIEKLGVEPQPERLERSITVNSDETTVWSIIDFLMKKSKGVLISETGEAKKYRVYVRGGVADVEFRVFKKGSSLLISFIVEGYDEHAREFFEYLGRELSYLGGGKE